MSSIANKTVFFKKLLDICSKATIKIIIPIPILDLKNLAVSVVLLNISSSSTFKRVQWKTVCLFTKNPIHTDKIKTTITALNHHTLNDVFKIEIFL